MASSIRNDKREYVQCTKCKHVKAFYQWFENPVIAVCGERNNERQVAATLRMCKIYDEADESQLPPIQHFESYLDPINGDD